MDVDLPFRDTSVGDPTLDGLDAKQALGERALSKLHWRSRRGLLENDLFIKRFFERHGSHLTVSHARGMYELMDLSDNDLLDIFLQRKEIPEKPLTEEALEVLRLLRH
jgi:antitoxin CptB